MKKNYKFYCSSLFVLFLLCFKCSFVLADIKQQIVDNLEKTERKKNVNVVDKKKNALLADIKQQITNNLKQAERKKNVLGKRRHIENALQLLENYNHINGHQILQNNDMSYVKLALSVYEKAIEINDSVFENSKPKEHIRIYIFEQQTYNKNLALLYHAYNLTKNNDYAKTAFLLTENYKNIELWRKDTSNTRFNILHKNELNDIQKKLVANQALISYHYGISNEKTDSSYAFVCTKDKVSFQTVIIDTASINQYVKELKRFVSKPKVYEKIAHKLYQDLLLPLYIDTATINKLTIFADGKLGLIPFDALVTQKTAQPNFTEMPYLLRQFAVNYDVSLPFWNKQKQDTKTNQNINAFLIVSPDFRKTNLKNLDYNAALAKNLSNNYQHTLSLQQQNANISKFKQQASKANIIHLASHAFLTNNDIKEPHIVLSDGYLLASQFTDTIFRQCNLAVLACCDTGNGSYKKGIGIRSLNYDFRKHGAQAVLATLWSVDDKATSTLLKDFYHFLEKGENKSRALNEAKLKYLQQDIKYKAPYYWAALMLNGQDNAIVLKKQNSAKQQTLSLSHLLLIVVSLIIVIILATTFDKKNT